MQVVVELLLLNKPSKGWMGEPEEKEERESLFIVYMYWDGLFSYIIQTGPRLECPEKTSIYWMK